MTHPTISRAAISSFARTGAASSSGGSGFFLRDDPASFDPPETNLLTRSVARGETTGGLLAGAGSPDIPLISEAA